MAVAVRTAALRLCHHQLAAFVQQRTPNDTTSPRSGGRGVHCLPLCAKHLPGWSSMAKSKRPWNAVRAVQDAEPMLLSTEVFPDGSILFRFGSRDEIVCGSSYSRQESNGRSPVWSEGQPAVADRQKNGAPASMMPQRDSGAKVVVPVDKGIADAAVLKEGAPELAKGTGSSKPNSVVENHTSSSNDKDAAALLIQQGKPKAPIAGRDSEMKDVDVPPTSVKDTSSQQPEDNSGKKQNYRLVSASAMLPRADKAATGGEDAFFITDNNWIGVSDGVGGWAMAGVDAGLYSKELMSHCEELARQSEEKAKPQDILTVAHSRTTSQGSATAIVAVLRGKTLELSNVGDSGFVLIREGKAVARSVPMQHAFNFPHQLARGNWEDADNYIVALEKGDVVVLGTDGLFDNLFEHQIVEVVDAFKEGRRAAPKVVANFLATLAQQVSKSSSGSSPFAVAAQAVNISYTGGKEDDITVVVSYVN